MGAMMPKIPNDENDDEKAAWKAAGDTKKPCPKPDPAPSVPTFMVPAFSPELAYISRPIARPNAICGDDIPAMALETRLD